MEMIPRLSQRQRRCFVDWFGIPEPECPPNHYRLLEVSTFERDPEHIAEAVARRRALVAVKAAETERHDDALSAHHYLNRVESVLLDPATKTVYDAELLAETGRWPASTNASTHTLQQAAHAPRDSPEWPVAVVPPPAPLREPPNGAPHHPLAPAGWNVLTTSLTVVAVVSVGLLGWTIAQGRFGSLGFTVANAEHGPVVGAPPETITTRRFDPRPGDADGAVDFPTGSLPAAGSTPVARSSEGAPNQQASFNVATSDALAITAAADAEFPPPAEVESPATRVALDPFERLPEAVNLPGTPNNRGRLLGMQLGKLGPTPDPLIVEIDQGAADLPDGQRLRVSRDEARDGVWNLGLSGGLQSDPLALVSISEEGTLRFEWLPGADTHDAVAQQLRNTALTLRVGRHTRWLPLRKAIEIEHALPHLGAGKHRVGLPTLPNRPKPESLRLEVLGVEGLCDASGEPYHSNLCSIQPFSPDFSTTSTGVMVLGESRVVLGDSAEVGVGVRLLSHPKTGPDLQIRPSYQGAQSGRTESAMTYQALESKVLLQQKRCNGRLRRFREAVASILNLSRQLLRHDEIAKAYRRRNSAQNAGHRHKAMMLNRDLGICRSTATIVARNIPSDYDLMERHFRIERHAKSFDASGGLRYRVYAQCGAGEIDLFRAVKPRGSYAKPNRVTQQAAGVVAEWLCLNPPAVCTLLPNGKSTVVDLTTARTGYGTWTQKADAVVLTGPRPYGRFGLNDGIRLVGRNAELFRYFQVDE